MALSTTSTIVFACYSKACAPPPAGKGGSSKGGSAKGYVVTARYDKSGNRTDNQPERTAMGNVKMTPHAAPKTKKKGDALDRKVAEWKKKGLVKTPKPSTKHNWTDPRDGTPTNSPYNRKRR